MSLVVVNMKSNQIWRVMVSGHLPDAQSEQSEQSQERDIRITKARKPLQMTQIGRPVVNNVVGAYMGIVSLRRSRNVTCMVRGSCIHDSSLSWALAQQDK